MVLRALIGKRVDGQRAAPRRNLPSDCCSAHAQAQCYEAFAAALQQQKQQRGEEPMDYVSAVMKMFNSLDEQLIKAAAKKPARNRFSSLLISDGNASCASMRAELVPCNVLAQAACINAYPYCKARAVGAQQIQRNKSPFQSLNSQEVCGTRLSSLIANVGAAGIMIADAGAAEGSCLLMEEQQRDHDCQCRSSIGIMLADVGAAEGSCFLM
eukprot:1153691-Pelagomonas_calceolata.AAC.1